MVSKIGIKTKMRIGLRACIWSGWSRNFPSLPFIRVAWSVHLEPCECVCVCVCVCVRKSVCVCMCECMCVRAYVSASVCMCVCVSTVRVCVCVCVWVWVCVAVQHRVPLCYGYILERKVNKCGGKPSCHACGQYCTYLLVKQSPEDRKWEEHDTDSKQQPHVLHKVLL